MLDFFLHKNDQCLSFGSYKIFYSADGLYFPELSYNVGIIRNLKHITNGTGKLARVLLWGMSFFSAPLFQERRMKIYISSDMEGTTGIVNWQETELGNKLYDHFSEQMSKEVAAACRGALSGGANEVLVKDAHSSARNINPDFLPRGTRILRGWTRNPFSMMAGLDESFTGAVFTGYHSPATWSDNPLAHTMTGGITWIRINGIPASELVINGWIAAYFKVPLLCVTGDEGICRQAEELFPGVQTVPVNKGLGNASISIHPQEAVERIESTVKSVLEAGLPVKPVQLPSLFEVELRFKEHHQAYYASFYPGVTRLDPHTIGYKTDSYLEFLKMFMFSH